MQLLLLAASLAASAWALGHLATPVPWVFLIWFAFLCEAAWRARSAARRAAWLYLATIPLALGLFEGYLAWGRGPRDQISYSDGYTVRDEVLGYAPRRGQASRSIKRHGDQVLYDVVYTIGANGLRISPPAPDAKACLLFFGDSITFGEGVNDREAFPYRVGVQTAGRYRVYNFAFHGYGPHQMLAALESGRVDEVIGDCRPDHIFYLTLFDHVSRAAGVRSWGRHGPRYELRGGRLERVGHFDDGDLLPPRVMQQLEGSLIVQRLLDRPGAIGAADVRRFVAIVAAARRLVETRYPGARFDVLQWGEGEALAPMAWAGLEKAGIRLHRYREILGDGADHPERYVLSPYDLHPNALGHQVIADYVVRLLDQKDTQGADVVPGGRSLAVGSPPQAGGESR
jgi:hypothetical protein